MSIIQTIKELRQQTGMSLKDCKIAVDAVGGDLEGAKKWLRENIKAKFDASSTGGEGCIGVYVHHNLQAATLVKLCCQTDFTAKNEEFTTLANDLALHITSAKPQWTTRGEIPPEVIAAECAILTRQTEKECNKPEIVEKIVNGRMKKFYEENVLLDQKFVKDGTPIIDMLKGLSAKTGENISVATFATLYF